MRGQRAGVEDRWHRPPRRGETPPYPADATGPGIWCMDAKHCTPATMVTTTRHGTGRRWLARWVDNQGQERTRSFDRKVEAQAQIKKVTVELGTHTYADPRKSSTTFATVAEEWFAAKHPTLKPATAANYRSLLDQTILPRWASVRLSDIDAASIQQWVTWMVTDPAARQFRTAERNRERSVRKPLSASRAVQAHGRFKQILDFAVRTKRLAVNPAVDVERPRIVHKRDRALTHAEVAALVEAAGDAGPIVLALGYTGLRFGELAALRVGDVDLKRRRILVTKGVTQVTGLGLVEDTAKTGENRTAPILTKALTETLKATMAGRPSDAYLFPAPDGGPMRNSYFRTRFDRACTGAGLTGISIKTLRHSAGSLALQSGASLVTVQRLLGHKDATTTLRHYSHMLPDDFDNLAAAMDKASTRAKT